MKPATAVDLPCAFPRRSRAWGHFPGKVRGVWVVRDILPCTFCFGLTCFAFNLFQPGGVGERSTAALEKAACFQSRSRLHCTRAGQIALPTFRPVPPRPSSRPYPSLVPSSSRHVPCPVACPVPENAHDAPVTLNSASLESVLGRAARGPLV